MVKYDHINTYKKYNVTEEIKPHAIRTITFINSDY